MKQMFLLGLATLGLFAADVTGTWTGILTRLEPDGTEKPGPAHLVLKQEGATVTGTAGPNAEEQHPMSEGKADNGTVTFELQAGGGVMKFTLKQEGEALSGSVTRDRDGEKQTAKLSVRREAAKP